MKRIAMIKNNLVENVVLVAEDSTWAPVGFTLVDVTDRPEIGPGWKHINSVFIIPDVENPPVVFQEITPRQVRLGLLSIGVSLAAIDAAIDSLDEPQRSVAQIDWKYAIAFKRDNPLVQTIGAMLGKTAAEIDQLWLYSETL